jgi:hypothetical protein
MVADQVADVSIIFEDDYVLLQNVLVPLRTILTARAKKCMWDELLP